MKTLNKTLIYSIIGALTVGILVTFFASILINSKLDHEIKIKNIDSILTNSKKPDLAKLLASYLAISEKNKNLKGFYGLLMEAAELKLDKIRLLNKTEVCEVYLKTLSMK